MRQLIIARKDLNMSPGKLAAQVSHASMAFLTNIIKNSPNYTQPDFNNTIVKITLQNDVLDEWINGTFTKIICEAKNRNQLLKAMKLAEELGLKKDKDFFLIKDNCLTDLNPEEYDENGFGRTLTCIGFRPLLDDVAWGISRKFHLYV